LLNIAVTRSDRVAAPALPVEPGPEGIAHRSPSIPGVGSSVTSNRSLFQPRSAPGELGRRSGLAHHDRSVRSLPAAAGCGVPSSPSTPAPSPPSGLAHHDCSVRSLLAAAGCGYRPAPSTPAPSPPARQRRSWSDGLSDHPREGALLHLTSPNAMHRVWSLLTVTPVITLLAFLEPTDNGEVGSATTSWAVPWLVYWAQTSRVCSPTVSRVSARAGSQVPLPPPGWLIKSVRIRPAPAAAWDYAGHEW